MKRIYLITVDNWCAAFAINYGSVEENLVKNFFSCPLCFVSFSFRTIAHKPQQLQIEFKRCSSTILWKCESKWYKFFVITSVSSLNTQLREDKKGNRRRERAHQFKLTMIIGFPLKFSSTAVARRLYLFSLVFLSLVGLCCTIARHDSPTDFNWAIWQHVWNEKLLFDPQFHIFLSFIVFDLHFFQLRLSASGKISFASF